MVEYNYQHNVPKCLLKNIPCREVALRQSDLYTIKNLREATVFIWLNNGKSFWYYVKYCTSSLLIGYVQDDIKWLYMPIKIASVEAYY